MKITIANLWSSWSFRTLIALFIFLSVYRLTHVDKKEISWDVFGYYLPLQATFIEGDMWMNDRSWVESLNEQHQVTGTLYQISSTPDNQPMYFFFLGMAMMYLPFFLSGHGMSNFLGYEQNGLTEPYIYALVIGGLLFAFIGLYYLRKILLEFFSDKLVVLLLIILVLGTNYVHHMSLKNLETVNVLFMFATLVIWNTIQWYKSFRLKNLLMVAISIVMMALIKPSEVLLILVPLLWNVYSKETLVGRVKLLWSYKGQLLIAIFIASLFTIPQVTYWLVKTGHIYYDSYKNPGVGLDVLTPHFYESLIGFRKGWLIYTPVMLFALIGFFQMYRSNRIQFFGLFIPFFIAFYIIVSWSEYWYGAGFSNRPVIVQYPILLIAMGYFFQWIGTKTVAVKWGIGIVVCFFIFLNQFQWWQLKSYILDANRMTASAYWSVFLKTKTPPDFESKLLVKRAFVNDEVHIKPNMNHYSERRWMEKPTLLVANDDGTMMEFGETLHTPFNELTSFDHCFAVFNFDYFVADSTAKPMYWSVMMSRSNGDYSPMYFELKHQNAGWNHMEVTYLTPEIRSKADRLKFFLWNPNFEEIQLKNFTVDILERK